MLRRNEKDQGQINVDVDSVYTQEIIQSYAALKGIMISHKEGTLSGGASGTYTANSLIKTINLKLGNVNLVKDLDADHLRELMQSKFGVAPLAEQWTLMFPPPFAIPRKPTKSCVIRLNTDTIGNIQGGDRTTLSNAKVYITNDMLVEQVPVKQALSPYIWTLNQQLDAYALGSTGSVVKNIDLELGKMYKELHLYVEDSGSADANALDGQDIKIKIGNRTFFESDIETILQKAYQRNGIAPSSGYIPIYLDEPISTLNKSSAYIQAKTESSPAGAITVDLISVELTPQEVI